MKGKVNGKEFAVYGRNAVDGAVTFYIQEYLLKGYGVRLNYRGWMEFCMDMGKDGDKKIIRIQAFEETVKMDVPVKPDPEPHRMLRCYDVPHSENSSSEKLPPDSCRTMTVRVTEYPDMPDWEEGVLMRGGKHISETVFYRIPDSDVYVTDKKAIAEILVERARRMERCRMPRFYVLPKSAWPKALDIARRMERRTRDMKLGKVRQIVHMYMDGRKNRRPMYIVFFDNKQGNFCTL